MFRGCGVGSYRGGQSLGSTQEDAYSDPDSNTYGDPDSYANAHSDPDGYTNGNGYVYADANGYSYANGNADSNFYHHTNSHSYIHANPNSYSYGYVHTNSYSDTISNSSCWSGSGLQFQRGERDDGNRCFRQWYYWQHHRSDLDHRRQIWQCVEFQWVERLCGPG